MRYSKKSSISAKAISIWPRQSCCLLEKLQANAEGRFRHSADGPEMPVVSDGGTRLFQVERDSSLP